MKEKTTVNSFLDDIFRSSPEGMMLLRADGQILWNNAAAVPLLASAGAIGLPGSQGCMAEPGPEAPQMPFKAGCQVDRNDPLRKLHGTKESISPEKELAFQVRIEKELQSAHLASLGELAAGVAHEINNPVTGIINCGQLLYDRMEEGSSDREIAQRIIREGERISAIVRSLLFLARAGHEGKERVRIEEELTDLLSLTRAQMRKERIIAIIRIPPELPAVMANPKQIRQVFLNLINNARYALNEKYPGFSEEKVLEIRGEKLNGSHPGVRFTILDHGTGIPDQILDRIFAPFFTTKPAGRGTGLGLSISHSIIADHHGKLGIESVEGKFTRVTIELPAAQGEL